MPGDKRGKKQFELLGAVEDTVTVYFPEMKGVNGIKPAHSQTYLVTENRCDMPNGVISAVVLSWQMLGWSNKGYKIDSRSIDTKTA